MPMGKVKKVNNQLTRRLLRTQAARFGGVALGRLAPYGIEVDMLNDGAVVLTRVFATDDEALTWARERHGRRESEGWQALPVVQTPDTSVRPA